ncbi:hypothetical protein [Mycobacterium sp. MAA66]|uniref:hypothetical protein n=1 Tax=Mycobacterium sp. MAA66 TaxID=3156297 RepID=UPI0035185C57
MDRRCRDRALPPRERAATLTRRQAQLLNNADFREDAAASIAAGTEIAGHAARLVLTALTADEVKTALNTSGTQIRRKRLDRELWAIPDGQTWRFPASQFDTDPSTGLPFRQVPGLAQLFMALPADMHPVAIDRFLHTPQPELQRSGKDRAPLDWLREGGDVDAAVDAVHACDWYGR